MSKNGKHGKNGKLQVIHPNGQVQNVSPEAHAAALHKQKVDEGVKMQAQFFTLRTQYAQAMLQNGSVNVTLADDDRYDSDQMAAVWNAAHAMARKDFLCRITEAREFLASFGEKMNPAELEGFLALRTEALHRPEVVPSNG